MDNPQDLKRSNTESVSMFDAQFAVGAVVQHQKFDYHGIVYDVDPYFMGSDEWYEAVAKSKPPKDQPWYHVLVDRKSIVTYVAERNLRACTQQTINHPLVDEYFTEQSDGSYAPRRLPV